MRNVAVALVLMMAPGSAWAADPSPDETRAFSAPLDRPTTAPLVDIQRIGSRIIPGTPSRQGAPGNPPIPLEYYRVTVQGWSPRLVCESRAGKEVDCDTGQ